MKKFVAAILGLFSIHIGVMLLLGTLFKIMHWPGANQMLIFGFGMSVIGYLLFTIYILFDILKSNFANKFQWTLGFVCCPMIVGILYVVLKDKITKDSIECQG